MNAVIFWVREQVSPSRGSYSALSKRRPVRVYPRNYLWMVIASVSIVLLFLIFRPLPYALGHITVVKSSFDWSNYTYHYPLESITPLPTGKPQPPPLPRVQHRFRGESRSAARQRKSRQQSVLETFRKGWQRYKTHAWLEDELMPITGRGKNPFGGWAATLVDSLDTLWIMGLRDDFYEAAAAAARIDWANTSDTGCNMFETNIRHLGGLIAAFDLSQEPALLAKAVELGDMLYAAFDTPSHMPPFWLDFESAKRGQLIAGRKQISATVGTFSLEFTRLSQITGDAKYYDAIARVTSLLVEHQASTKLPGMWPVLINVRDQTFDEDSFTLGALADSLYEYLPKMHYLLGGREPAYERAYLYSMSTTIDNLLFRPKLPKKDNGTDVLVAGSATVGANKKAVLNPEGQHLACFVGGMFALGGRLFHLDEHVDIGARLTRGCIYAYDAFPTGIMPEIFQMRACPWSSPLDDYSAACEWEAAEAETAGLPAGFASVADPSYKLRPEAIESVFVLYRTTGDPALLDAAWRMFESIRAATATTYANAAVLDVNAATTASGRPVVLQQDSMESFWFAETLKYFYLIFSPPDLISLDDYVLNTEAHPFRLPK